MARILYVAKLAVDRDGLPLVGVRGVAGTIIKRGTPSVNPVITEDQAGTLVIPDSALTVTEQGFIPSFWVDEADMPVSWWDGAIEVPLETTEGLAIRVEEVGVDAAAARDAAETAAQAAQDAANLVDAPADSVVATLLGNSASASYAAADVVADAAAEAAVAPVRPDNNARAVGKGELVVNVRDYGAIGDGIADDTAAIQAALDALSAGTVLYFPQGAYRLATQVNVAVNYVTIRGAGRQSTVLTVPGDHIGLNVTGHYVVIEDLEVACTTLARTVYPVKFAAANHGAIRRCYFQGGEGSWRSGVHFEDGSMGSVFDSTFNHSCIYIDTWDVKVDRCYIWAMTCEYGIGLATGSGNATITNTDVVAPLTSTANAKAGIYFQDTAGFNTKISDVYIDGSWPSLTTRPGIWITNGCAAIQMTSISANQMKSDVIVIDSAYNILINGYSGYKNNDAGLAAREIVVKQTGAQPVENVRITGAHFLRTTAVTGTAAAAVEIESPVSGSQVSIHDFDVKQPTAGGGYTLPEIKFHSLAAAQAASMSGRGELSVYYAHGSQSVASGATGATINLGSPYPMAYRPLASDVTLQWENGGSTYMPRYRVQFTADNQIFIGFDAAVTPGTGTLHWRVDFRRR